MLPTLYGKDAKGKDRFWKISYSDDSIEVTHGCVGGQEQTSCRTFEGKNVGRKNETSPEEQARLEAEKMWITQVYKKGYRPEPSDTKATKWVKDILKAAAEQNGVINGLNTILRGKGISGNLTARTNSAPGANTIKNIKCTLAQQWGPKATKYFDVKDGVWIQPKYDGVRVLAYYDGSKVRFISRGSKEYPHLELLKKRIGRVLIDQPEIILDGELYAEVLYGKPIYKNSKVVDFEPSDRPLSEDMKFDVIAGVGKPVRSKPHPLEGQLKMYVFDLLMDAPQKKRFERLEELFDTFESNSIVMAPTIKLESLEDIPKYHSEFTSLGYEGSIIRANCPTYEQGKKSLYIRKHKDMQDAEFEITGSKLDPGVDKEFFVFTLTTADGKEFHAKPMGARETRLDYYARRKDLVGSFATVKFQKMSKDGVPIFGVVKCIRELV